MPRNLLRNSGIRYENNAYPTHSYTLATDIKPGTQVTCRIWGSFPDDKTVRLYNTDSSLRLSDLQKQSDGTYLGTFTWINELNINGGLVQVDKSTSLLVYGVPKGDPNPVAVIEKIALYKGSVALEWEPAPEDLRSTKGLNLILNSSTFTGKQGNYGNNTWEQFFAGFPVVTKEFDGVKTLYTDDKMVKAANDDGTLGNAIFGDAARIRCVIDRANTENIYTLSFDMRGKGSLSMFILNLENSNTMSYIKYNCTSNITPASNSTTGGLMLHPTTEWERASITFSISPAGAALKNDVMFCLGRFYVTQITGDRWLELKNIKAEPGETATPYSIAPQDSETTGTIVSSDSITL